MIDITIFTPAYNRAKTLPRLYDSLCKQTGMTLEWLIIDDGSTDDTAAIVKSMIDEGKITIRYIKKSNGGKHTAHNVAIKEAKGKYFFTVDSDDWLPEYALSTISKLTDRLTPEWVAGIIALKEYPDKKMIGKPYDGSIKYASAIELTNMGMGGERSLIFKTSVISRYPFPVIPGERFMTEAVIYDRIDMAHKYLVSNSILTTCEYQPDGLSSNITGTMVKNPTGYKIYFAQRIDSAPSLKVRLANVLKYAAFRHMSDDKQFNYNGNHKLLVSLFTPLGALIARYYTKRTTR